MKKRAILLGVICILLFTGIVGGIAYILRGQDENKLTIQEKE